MKPDIEKIIQVMISLLEEQEKVNNHYPAALSFSTTPKQEL